MSGTINSILREEGQWQFRTTYFKRVKEQPEIGCLEMTPLSCKEDYLEKLFGKPTRFSYEDLKAITGNFSEVLGEGGFGKVLKGILLDGIKMAVTQIDGSSQVRKSFLTWLLHGVCKEAFYVSGGKFPRDDVEFEGNLDNSSSNPALETKSVEVIGLLLFYLDQGDCSPSSLYGEKHPILPEEDTCLILCVIIFFSLQESMKYFKTSGSTLTVAPLNGEITTWYVEVGRPTLVTVLWRVKTLIEVQGHKSDLGQELSLGLCALHHDRKGWKEWLLKHLLVDDLIAAGLHSGCLALSKAAIPLTCGHDMEVPERPKSPDQAASMFTPGATISGFRISRVSKFGPLDENAATTGEGLIPNLVTRKARVAVAFRLAEA
ncbi:hypothetical protein SADUNF_Sadunf12G0102600 [Salix dunnii]|uniref:Uncharacterized protein n=1 Tax=Salix dunnii TaxID=1413687 RepID=A0A835JJD3_9ROSI|nr:hypothetical protein SADUNF_Sadunf12G0102600 [Salix dunnii]